MIDPRGAPRRYAPVDAALFDARRVPVPGDGRTVGEMLASADQTARQLLMDVTADDAAALLRGWPELVEATAELWDALPSGPPAAGAVAKDEPSAGRTEPLSVAGLRTSLAAERSAVIGPMQQLAEVAGAMHSDLASGWPGEGLADRRLGRMKADYISAARLVRRYGADVPTDRPEVRADIAASRMWVMHGLRVAAHGVSVALLDHGRELYRASVSEGRPLQLSTTSIPYAVPPTGRWTRRIGACEQIAARWVGNRYATTLAGEVAAPMEDPGRLERALAQWDVQSHRTLARDPSPADLVLVARGQGQIVGAVSATLEAASQAGARTEPPTREGVLTECGRAWMGLASRWADLTTPHQCVDPQMVRAANELQAAYREFTHDGPVLATAEAVAARPGLSRAVDALLHAVQTAPDLATTFEARARAGGMRGPARLMSIRANNDVEAGLARSPGLDADATWVSPSDVMANRVIPAPLPVVKGILRESRALVTASEAAASSATLTQGVRSSAPAHGRPHSPGLKHDRSTPLAASPSTPPLAGPRR